MSDEQIFGNYWCGITYYPLLQTLNSGCPDTLCSWALSTNSGPGMQSQQASPSRDE